MSDTKRVSCTKFALKGDIQADGICGLIQSISSISRVPLTPLMGNDKDPVAGNGPDAKQRAPTYTGSVIIRV